MEETEALRVLSALAQPTRLRVLALLAAAGTAGQGSSEIADAVGVPRNLMSSHLAVLSKAGAVASRRSGRSVTYVVNEAALAGLAEYLMALVEGHEAQTTSG